MIAGIASSPEHLPNHSICIGKHFIGLQAGFWLWPGFRASLKRRLACRMSLTSHARNGTVNLRLQRGEPRVSIIVPARNEEEDIRETLTQLLALEYSNYEIIAVNDRSTDRTGQIMDEVAARAARSAQRPC